MFKKLFALSTLAILMLAPMAASAITMYWCASANTWVTSSAECAGGDISPMSATAVVSEVPTQQEYVDEATAELETYVGSEVSDYYMSCSVSGTGEIAVCNGQAAYGPYRVSESFTCSAMYVGDSYTGIECNIREHHPSDEGSVDRY